MSVKRAINIFSPRRPVHSREVARQQEVRGQMLAHLSESTKAVQHEFHDRDEAIPSCELANELCRSIEALFIHGLKDTFLDMVSSVMSDTRPPEPNFWPPLLVISHADVIHQIARLSQIRTEIGKCRAWLRVALNDGLLTSYLAMIVQDRRLLGYHYDKFALMRDKDQMDIAQRYLQGLEALTFALATNSSLLNVWDEAPLELAGIWFQPRQLGAGSVAQGQDVAASITEPSPRRQPPAELALPLPEPRAPTLIMNALDPDMAFDVIMRTTSVDDLMRARPPAPAGPSGSAAPAGPAAPAVPAGGSGCDSEASSLAGELAAITTPPPALPARPPPAESYISVLESYRESSPRARSLMQTPDVQFVFGCSADSSTCSSRCASAELEQSGEPADEPDEASSSDSEPEDPRRRWLAQIASERGLDSQRYTCGGCQRFVGMLYGQPRLCSFDGLFYCSDCHTGGDQVQLPARMVHNWDFEWHPVARRSREFLEHSDGDAVINVAEENVSLYNVSAEMERVRLLRTRLVFLNAFLHTCRSGAAAELDQRLAGRLHLSEHVHLFAPVDLREAKLGSLARTLTAVVEFAVGHVLACSLCSQKGFVCEFCKDSKIIYPFELETTRQCRQCYGLYHSRCWRRPTPCPRCERYRRRAELRRLLEEPELCAAAAGGQQPAAGGQQPTAGGQQPTAGGQQPAAASQQPTAASQQPAASEPDRHTAGQTPAVVGVQAASTVPV